MSQATKGRILVIDDSKTVRDIASQLLGAEGYQVLTSKDAIDALSAALDFSPQLIITDVQMKPLDGFQTISLLRMNPDLAAVPVIISSSQGGAFDLARGKLVGVVNYIVKPFNKDGLLRAVADCILCDAAAE